MLSVTGSYSYRPMHAMTRPEAESDPAFLCALLLLADMFSFLQQSTELQKQVLQFIYGGRDQGLHTGSSSLHDTL